MTSARMYLLKHEVDVGENTGKQAALPPLESFEQRYADIARVFEQKEAKYRHQNDRDDHADAGQNMAAGLLQQRNNTLLQRRCLCL